MKKETRSIGSFMKIQFKDFGRLILSQGDQESLSIEADEQFLPELISEVRDGTLVLGVDDDWLGRVGKVISSVFSTTEHDVTYNLTCVNLDEISISGKCNFECDSLKANDLTFKVSGLGNVTFTYLDCNTLQVNIGGRAEFAAAGRADHQQVRISGSGDYQAPDLESKTLRIVISGQGNASVRVAEDLDITISGLGQVNYHGQPKIRQVISGLGKSHRLNDA